MKNKIASFTGLLTILVIVLAINLMASILFSRVKIDMTEEKLFTLSPGTVNILESLDEEITAKVYYSKTAGADIPQFRAYAVRVLEMLNEYESVADGKISIEIFDPRPDTEEEEGALRFGLQGISGGAAGERIFLGMVVRDENGNESSIPFFNPSKENSLEYDITKAFYAISHPERKKVGVITGLDVLGSEPTAQNQQGVKPWTFVRHLKSQFAFEKIEFDTQKIADDYDLVLIIHPKELPDTVRYAIDQYVLRGGNVLVCVDPGSQIDMPQGMGRNPQMLISAKLSSDMPELFKAWGIAMISGDEDTPSAMGLPGGMGGKNRIVVDPDLAMDDPSQQGRRVKNLAWLNVNEEHRNEQEIVTGQLDNMMMFYAGGLKNITVSDQVEIVSLMHTGETASTMEELSLRFNAGPDSIRQSYEPGSQALDLAVKISGKFNSAFPEGRPVDASDESSALLSQDQHLSQSVNPSTIIVVADVDMITDMGSVQIQNFFGQEMIQMVNDNLPFLTNALENLTGSQDLIGLRSRGRSQRPFTLVNEIERAAQEKYRKKEEVLSEKLKAANQRLSEMQRGGSDRTVLNQALMAERKNLLQERADTQRELRGVRRNLRENVESLGMRIKLINIALIPLIVIIVSLSIAIVKSGRRRTL